MKNKLEVLKSIAIRFNEMNIHYAVGASVLLFFKGIVDEFHDIDILIDNDDTEKVMGILNEMGKLLPQLKNNNFKTKTFLEYVVNGVDIDVIGGFVIVKDGIDYDCSLQKDINDFVMLDDVKIPLDTLQNWQHYYDLMGRNNKVALINNYLKSS